MQNSCMPDSFDEWIEKVCEADPILVDLDDDDDGEPVVGPSLTPEEIQVARIRLARWQCVKAFSADTKALCNRCRSADYFLQPRLKFLHNAHVLAKFARLQSVDQVRLADHDENWPDGFVKIQNRAFNIEVTSTHGGRKLGDEYRHLKGWRFDPVEDWVARANSIPKYLDEAISGKSKKNYSSPCWLVAYLNISEYGIRQPETEQVNRGYQSPLCGGVRGHHGSLERQALLMARWWWPCRILCRGNQRFEKAPDLPLLIALGSTRQ
jgi:hypothetical protein